MQSIVAIWNLALVRIGRSELLSPLDDSNEARACASAWANTRDMVLTAHEWNCAVARVQLAPLVTPPPFGFSFGYQLPADFLRLASVDMIDWRWKIEGRTILSDEGPTLDMVYVRRIDDPAEMDHLLKATLGLHLASAIAVRVTGDRNLAESLHMEYINTLDEARLADAQQARSRSTARYLQNARFFGDAPQGGLL